MTASQFQHFKAPSETLKASDTFVKIIRKVTNSKRFIKDTQLKRASLPAQSSPTPSFIKPIPRRCSQAPPQEFWWWFQKLAKILLNIFCTILYLPNTYNYEVFYKCTISWFWPVCFILCYCQNLYGCQFWINTPKFVFQSFVLNGNSQHIVLYGGTKII